MKFTSINQLHEGVQVRMSRNIASYFQFGMSSFCKNKKALKSAIPAAYHNLMREIIKKNNYILTITYVNNTLLHNNSTFVANEWRWPVKAIKEIVE